MSWKAFLNCVTGKGSIRPWEIMVSQKLQNSPYLRAVLKNTQAWTLHPKDRSSNFIKALPNIIQKIESGSYPKSQAGYYDLISELWF